MTTIEIPDFSLVLLVGTSGSGKSTFAARHFADTEIVSLDRCRALVGDDSRDQSLTTDAAELLKTTVELRLKNRRPVVVDATNLRPEDRRTLTDLAVRRHAMTVAIVLDVPPSVARARLAERDGPGRGDHVRHQSELMHGIVRMLKDERFGTVRLLKGVEEIDVAELVRVPLWNDRRADTGPFDVVGDVHGCFSELRSLMERLGWEILAFDPSSDEPIRARHPEGRRIVFVGDLTDRGPSNLLVLRLALGMTADGTALGVMGNHDAKLRRFLGGAKVTPTHGLDRTLAELEGASRDLKEGLSRMLDGFLSHYWFDSGRLVVAHAGLTEDMHGRGSAQVRSFAMYGDVTGELDEGLPVRRDWARDYSGKAAVVYGHTPHLDAAWVRGTICIDTGCVFGGSLTALRWPEREIVSVPAERTWCEPRVPLEKRFVAPTGDDVLRWSDFARKVSVATSFGRTVVVPEDQSLAALEALSRSAVDPRWLVYVPPTMSPPPVSQLEGHLEHPREAIAHYVSKGCHDLVAEEKHMGSRAVFVVAASEEAAARTFASGDGRLGAVYTRNGRAFFPDPEQERRVVARAAAALGSSGVFAELACDWIVLDAEILPWSWKAGGLIEEIYAPTHLAASASARAFLAAASGIADPVVADLAARARATAANSASMACTVETFSRPPANGEGILVAPFHLMASSSGGLWDRGHDWHMEQAVRLSEADALFVATRHRLFDGRDPGAVDEVVSWWEDLTRGGGEGAVLKPRSFVTLPEHARRQPAIKVRGREYLRLIYGVDYDVPSNLSRLRDRRLDRKQRMASSQFVLGLEGLSRLVAGEPLRRVHECVHASFAVAAEGIDPRL